MKNIKFGSSESGSESSKDSSEYYVFNLKFFSDFYDAITSALSVQYEGIFKSKAEERPFAESQEAKPPLERVQIEEVFLKFTHGNGSESGYVKGLDKQIPMYALQRKPSNNDSLNREERKTAFRTECPLPTEIQASPDIILLSESLPLKSEPYSDEFKSHKIRAVEEKGVLPSVIHTERGVSGLMLPIKPHMGQEISIHEEAETPMQNSISKALKPTQDPPQLFTKLFQLGLEVIDTFGMVITTEKFRVEYMGYQKQNPPTSERTKEEDKNNKSVKIRTYADDSTIKRFQTKIDSKFMVGESEPVPFVIPLGQARLGLPPLSSIQEEDLLTKNLTDRINSNKNPLNTVGEKENPIEKNDPIFRNIMKNFVKEEFSNTFNYSNAQTVDRVFERLVNSNEITPDNFLDSFGKRNEYDNTIKKYSEYLDNDRTNQSETDVIKYSFRPEMLSSQPPGGAKIFDIKTEGGWYNGKKVNSLSESFWDSVDRPERPENSKDELTNAKPADQVRGDGEVSAPLNVKLDNSIIEEVGGFLTNQINEFKKVANGVASIFGQDAKASETYENEEPQSKIQIRSFGECREDDLEQKQGLNNSVPEDCQKQIIATTTYKNLGSKNNTKIIINHSCYAPVQTEEQLKLMRTNASILKSKNRYEINPAYKPTKKDLTDTHLHGSRSYKDKRGLMINPGNGGTRLNSAQESLLVENLGTKKPVRRTNSNNFIPLSSIQDVSEPIVPSNSLHTNNSYSAKKVSLGPQQNHHS